MHKAVLPLIPFGVGGRNMSKNKFPKSVSFNLKNENDQAILEHVKRRNFSGYVKKLILADMGKGHIEVPDASQEEQQQQSPLSKYELLRRQLESAKQIHSNPQSNPNTESDSEKHK